MSEKGNIYFREVYVRAGIATNDLEVSAYFGLKLAGLQPQDFFQFCTRSLKDNSE